MGIQAKYIGMLRDTIAVIVALAGGFIVPLTASILMAVGASKTTDMDGQVIAVLASAICFVALPVNCMVLAAFLKMV